MDGSVLDSFYGWILFHAMNVPLVFIRLSVIGRLGCIHSLAVVNTSALNTDEQVFVWPQLFLRRRQWHPTPVLLPGKPHGRRSLAGCSPWGHWGSDTTERLHFHFSLSYIGEGNGTPLQCSCLGNPMDGGAWWAAVHGVAKSRTWLSDFTFTFHFHALEKEMATHSSVLAWRIPGMAEPGGHRVGHDWSDLAAAAAVVKEVVRFCMCF